MNENKTLPLKEQIYEYCRRGAISFAEIEREFGKGEFQYGIVEKNVYFWYGLTAETIGAVVELIKERKILYCISNWMIYAADGKIPTSPIAKDNKQYKKERWLPVVIWRTEMVKGLLKPKERKFYRNMGYDV